MTNRAGQPGLEAEPKNGPAEKKVYAAPKLTRLGSVRELTLGRSGSFSDGNGFMMMTM